MPVELERGISLACRIRRMFPDSAKRRLHVTSKNFQIQQSSIDDSDIKKFAKLSPEWSKEDGSFKALYSMNRLRLPLIVDTIGRKVEQGRESLSGLSIADIGCGGGILAFPLARLGARVAAVDASEDVIASVREAENRFSFENHGSGSATFHCSSVEDFAAKNPGSKISIISSRTMPCYYVYVVLPSYERMYIYRAAFDAIVASEIIEHVADAELFVELCVRLVRKSGALFFTTINKTVASRILAIWLAENVLGVVPPGVHQWSKFIAPRSLQMILEENGCSVRSIHGMVYNPFMNRWSWSRNTAVNYALVAVRVD